MSKCISHLMSRVWRAWLGLGKLIIFHRCFLALVDR